MCSRSADVDFCCSRWQAALELCCTHKNTCILATQAQAHKALVAKHAGKTRLQVAYVLHTQSQMAHLLHRHRQPSSTIASSSIKAAHDHCHNTLLLHVPRCRHNTLRTITLLKSHGAKRIFFSCCSSDQVASSESSTLARWRKKPNKKYQ